MRWEAGEGQRLSTALRSEGHTFHAPFLYRWRITWPLSDSHC